MKKPDLQRELPLSHSPSRAPEAAVSPHLEHGDDLDPVCTLEFVCHAHQLDRNIRSARRERLTDRV